MQKSVYETVLYKSSKNKNLSVHYKLWHTINCGGQNTMLMTWVHLHEMTLQRRHVANLCSTLRMALGHSRRAWATLALH